MLVGHVAVGFIVKRAHPRMSLGLAVFAALLADFLVFALILAGVEHVHFGTGRGAGQYFIGEQIAFSHSFLANVVCGAALALIAARRSRDRRAAWLLGAAVVSHWVLDFVSHRPDMPLAPWLPWKLGLGLWTSIPATLVVEGGLWFMALAVFTRSARPLSRARTAIVAIGAALLTLVWIGNIAGPPPSNPATAPVASLVFFSLVVLWTYWLDRRAT